FQRDFVSCQNANAIAPQPACQVRKNDAVVLQLNAEQTTRKLLKNGSGNFYAVFLTHSTSRILAGAALPVRPPSVLREPASACDRFHVGGLQTFRPARHFELPPRAFVQRLVSIRLNGGKMHE